MQKKGQNYLCIEFVILHVNFNLPEWFDITYMDSNGEKRWPIMIHRAVLGSLERFFGVLIEHYVGDFVSPLLMPRLTSGCSTGEQSAMFFRRPSAPMTDLIRTDLGMDPKVQILEQVCLEHKIRINWVPSVNGLSFVKEQH